MQTNNIPSTGFLRLPQVLEIFPVSKSTWWAGISKKLYPAGVRLSNRTTAWKVEDMDFDDCLTAGVLDDDPRKAVEILDTYSEISPSGEGIRLFVLHGKIISARKLKVDGKSREIYSSGRYLTVTGHIIGQTKEVCHVV